MPNIYISKKILERFKINNEQNVARKKGGESMMNGVFTAVSSELSYFERNVYSRPSMIAISHAIEDVVMNFQLESDLFVSFQKFEFFLYEKERYLELEKFCRKIFIFA